MVLLSQNILEGDFNLDIGRFIVSPLYPFLISGFKSIFANWELSLFLFQLIYSSFSSVLIYKIGVILFDKIGAKLGAFIYTVFPLTFWYVNTFSQETLFQCLLITFFYFFIKSLKNGKIRDVIFSGIFYSLAFLTKSHILIFSVFIPVLYWLNTKNFRITVKSTFTIGFVSLFFTLPFGLFNYINNGIYVLSSNGALYQFYLGNSNAGYVTIAAPPGQGTDDFKKIQNINVTAGYFNGHPKYYDSLLKLPQDIKQNLFFKESLKWIENNPKKFLHLKFKNLISFITPGISYHHYPLKFWALSLILSLPIYFLSILGILIGTRSSKSLHQWIIYLIVTMTLFSLVWYTQNRFRTITLEPFLCLYAGLGVNHLLKKNKRLKPSTA